jgi:two-component sensor histidine kinase
MVITELMQNAVEHGYAGESGRGQVQLVAERKEGGLHVEVLDDGLGLPPGFDPGASDRLGLQIVRTLVETELGGEITLGPRARGGTVAAIDVVLAVEG